MKSIFTSETPGFIGLVDVTVPSKVGLNVEGWLICDFVDRWHCFAISSLETRLAAALSDMGVILDRISSSVM